MKKFIMSMSLAAVLVATSIGGGVQQALASGGLTLTNGQSAYTGDIDFEFKIDTPRQGILAKACAFLDGQPFPQGSRGYTQVFVYDPKSFPIPNTSDYDMGDCLSLNFPYQMQNKIHYTGINSKEIVNGEHTFKLEATYTDGSVISGTVNFSTLNDSITSIKYDELFPTKQTYGQLLVLRGVFAKSSEPLPQEARFRVIQGKSVSVWKAVPVVDGKFHLATMKITTRTEVQISASIAGQARSYKRVVDVMPNITLSFTNLRVGKLSKTVINTGAMKTGMCQLEVDDNAYWVTTHTLPIRKSVASITQTFKTRGTYSGKVICAGPGFIDGELSFRKDVSLG
jgi:hypothetical protein